ncbi:hypothetical protein ACCC92_02950 [Mucilaginibacter sp. Mucisp84]|uniref:hypothetical protein n=1 Tax=Mucilaginibacter sp. Mucisp84 TaxID=3243058 RepID=UPI0039A4AA6C
MKKIFEFILIVISQAYLRRSVEIIGTNRILFSADYPCQYRPGRDARNFFEATALSEVDKKKARAKLSTLASRASFNK